MEGPETYPSLTDAQMRFIDQALGARALHQPTGNTFQDGMTAGIRMVFDMFLEWYETNHEGTKYVPLQYKPAQASAIATAAEAGGANGRPSFSAEGNF